MSDNSNKHHLRSGRGAWSTRWSRGAVLVAVAAVTAALAGCASSATSAPSQPPTAKLVPTAGSSVPSVQLTQLGATRIGLETAPVAVGQGGEATFPYSALLYESNGRAAVYVSSGPLTFTRHFVTVDTINGTVVTVTSGVTPGRTASPPMGPRSCSASRTASG